MDAHIDTHIAALAARQHGVVTRRQLVALGLGRGAIAARLRSGRLHRLFRGVYAVGHPRVTASGRRLAAVLACGPGAVLSHETAADLLGLRPSASPRIHVTVPGTSARSVPGVLVHRARTLRAQDVTVADAIPVTSVARTLSDLAARHDVATLRKAMERAERLRTFDRDLILDVVAGRPGRRLAAALDAADPAPFRSDLESDFVARCLGRGLPRPEVNATVEGLEVDLVWRMAKLVVELDGWAFHRSRRSFAADRRRDVRLSAAGYTVLRFADVDADERAVEEVARRLGY